jgi:hypothetical protein
VKASVKFPAEAPGATAANEPAGLGTNHANVRKNLLRWGVIVFVAVAYLASVSPGHVFVNDDFAAYVMHAANLVEGRPYTFIHYVPNPQALWLAPTNGYPPVYPMILAPAYKVWGLNLRALKIVTVLCFVGFLVIFELFTRPMLSPLLSICALLVLSLNPIFWDQRNYILSEFPYLMFSFGALLVIQYTYKDLSSQDLRLGAALLLSVLLYGAYGTRTVGIALVPALAVADFVKFKRPSRFLVMAVAFTAVLFFVQAVFFTWPKGYISAFQFSPQLIFSNALYYAKTLSYMWQNGFSKELQIVFALSFTALAGVGFVRSLVNERSAREFYLLGYLAILFAWTAEIGLRGLLPILPLYVAYGLREFGRVIESLGAYRAPVITALLVIVGVTYSGEIRKESRQQPEPNVQDPAARELFGFLRAQTQPSDVLVFPKPRSLALFTNHAVASLAFNESPEDSTNFMKSIHATVLVKTGWSPPSWQHLLESDRGHALEIFHNSDYQVFRFNWESEYPTSMPPGFPASSRNTGARESGTTTSVQ